MNQALILCGYLITITSAILLLQGFYRLKSHALNNNKEEEFQGEGQQSMFSGITIILISIIFSLFQEIFVFAGILGAYLIWSGFRFLQKSQTLNLNKGTVKKVYPLLFILLMGQFFFGIAYINTFNVENIDRKKMKTNVNDIEKVSGTKVVTKRGYARTGPSSKNEILGICPKGTEVKLLGKQSGFYFVKGSYQEGEKGLGKKKSEKFWIGGGLLSQEKKKSSRSWFSSKPSSKEESPKKKAKKSWPNFD